MIFPSLRRVVSVDRQHGLRKCSTKFASDESYCVNLVKTHDFDNYLAGLLVPQKSRGCYFAIRAFNVEIAMIREQTKHNGMAGKLRFEWWQDIINEIYNGNSSSQSRLLKRSPVAAFLSHHIQEKNLSSVWFQRTIQARQDDMIDQFQQPQTLDQLEDYAEHGHSSILYLILESLGIQDKSAEYAASHIGVSSGIATILRGFPHHISYGKVYIPRDIQESKILRLKSIFQGPDSDDQAKALRDCVFEVASQANGHLEKGKELQLQCDPKAIYALLPAIRTSSFLESLRHVDFDLFDANIERQQLSQFQLQMKLLYATWSKKL